MLDCQQRALQIDRTGRIRTAAAAVVGEVNADFSLLLLQQGRQVQTAAAKRRKAHSNCVCTRWRASTTAAACASSAPSAAELDTAADDDVVEHDEQEGLEFELALAGVHPRCC